jgi:hypothetical protein
MIYSPDTVNEIALRNSLPLTASILNNSRDPYKTTVKYKENDDLAILQGLNERDWFVQSYKQVKNHSKYADRAPYKPFIATYVNKNLPAIDGEGNLTLIHRNAKDGTKMLELLAGFYRLVCSNGLIIGYDLFEPIRVKHIGDVPKQLDDVVTKLLDVMPGVYTTIKNMKEVVLTRDQQVEFAQKAIETRFDGQKYVVDPQDVLSVRREADNKSDLWTVFNRCQENLIKAENLIMTTKDSKKRKAKAITNIDLTFKINTGLWGQAAAYLQ